jgi:hypothetical protein
MSAGGGKWKVAGASSLELESPGGHVELLQTGIVVTPTSVEAAKEVELATGRL